MQVIGEQPQENSFRQKVSRFLNSPASRSSVQPFFVPARILTDDESKDPLFERIRADKGAAR